MYLLLEFFAFLVMGMAILTGLSVLCQTDITKVTGISPSGASNNEVTFNLPAVLTATPDTYDMAIRDSTNRVRMTAPVEVRYAANVPD